jgi:hypothetical protein
MTIALMTDDAFSKTGCEPVEWLASGKVILVGGHGRDDRDRILLYDTEGGESGEFRGPGVGVYPSVSHSDRYLGLKCVVTHDGGRTRMKPGIVELPTGKVVFPDRWFGDCTTPFVAGAHMFFCLEGELLRVDIPSNRAGWTDWCIDADGCVPWDRIDMPDRLSVSPCEEKIAWCEDGELLVYDLSKRSKHYYFIHEGGVDGTPRWSPCGRWIAISGTQLHVVNVDGGDVISLGEETGDERGPFYSDPDWSPRDGAVACTETRRVKPRDYNSRVLLFRLSPAQPLSVREESIMLCWKGLLSRPVWSPDGGKLVVGLVGAGMGDVRDEKCAAGVGESIEGMTLLMIDYLSPGRLDDTHRIEEYDEIDPSASLMGKGIDIVSLPEPVRSRSLPCDCDYLSQAGERADEATMTNISGVPYIHQLYDTPEWFNGDWACGPTSCLMVVQYYRKLPFWLTRVSIPYSHVSKWGNHVAGQYTHGGVTYSWVSNDPWSRPARGAYGYVCPGGYAYWSRMEDYLDWHGLTTYYDDSPTWDELVSHLNAGRPCVLSTMLTDYGHIVVATGYYSNHTVICRDPYGDKSQGYPNYYREAAYDWPGYNNGNPNFNSVRLILAGAGTKDKRLRAVIDDGTPDVPRCSFEKFGPSEWWWESDEYGCGNPGGTHYYTNGMYYTYAEEAGEWTNWCQWGFYAHRNGYCTFQIFIPQNHATTTNATYYHYHETMGQTSLGSINQNIYYDEWVTLKSHFYCRKGWNFLQLGDVTGETGYPKIGVDAVQVIKD